MATNIGTVGSAQATKTPKPGANDELMKQKGADIGQEPMLKQLNNAAKKNTGVM